MGNCISQQFIRKRQIVVSRQINKQIQDLDRTVFSATYDLSLTDLEIQALTNGLLNQIVTCAAGSSQLVPNQDIDISMIDNIGIYDLTSFTSIISHDSDAEKSFTESLIASRTREKLLIGTLTRQYSQQQQQQSQLTTSQSQSLFFKILDKHPEIYERINSQEYSESDNFQMDND
eukprot:EST44550.1 Hypothetical protein SS50377_15550 [Spironucleus salmonicida]